MDMVNIAPEVRTSGCRRTLNKAESGIANQPHVTTANRLRFENRLNENEIGANSQLGPCGESAGGDPTHPLRLCSVPQLS